MEPEFAGFFLNKLLGKPNYVDDLASLDADLHGHLLSLKTYKGDLENDMCLYFDVRCGWFTERLAGEAVGTHLTVWLGAGHRRPLW